MGSKKGVRRGPYKKTALKSSGRVFCFKCGKSYTRRPILLHHIQSVHMKKLVECTLCPKKFVSMSVCNRHIKTVHNIANPKQIPRNSSPITSSSADSFEPHTSFPWIANSISLQKSRKFGIHIKAERDINAGPALRVNPWLKQQSLQPSNIFHPSTAGVFSAEKKPKRSSNVCTASNSIFVVTSV